MTRAPIYRWHEWVVGAVGSSSVLTPFREAAPADLTKICVALVPALDSGQVSMWQALLFST